MVELDWRLILDGFADAVVAANCAGHIVYTNHATERLLGWSAGELVGQPLAVIQPPRLREAHVAGFTRYLDTREPMLIGRTVRVPALRHDGTEIDIELTLSVVRPGPETRDDIFIAALRDLSERDEVERHLAITRYLRASTDATAKLIALPSLDDMLRAAVDTLTANFESALARIWLYNPESNTLHLRASAGLSTKTATSSRSRIDLATYPYKVGEVARTRQPLVRNDLRGDVQFDQDWIARERIASIAAFPLLIGDSLLGVLVSFSRQPLPAELVETLANFAAIVTVSINDLRHLEREQAARHEAEAVSQRAAFLAEASAVFATSLDEPPILRQLADRIVPSLADWCVFDMIDDDGSSRRAAIKPADPELAGIAHELEERYPVDPNAPDNVVAKVLRTGQPSLMADVPDELLVAAARDAHHLELLRSFGITSHMVVPLIARGRTLGAVTIGSTTSGRRYGPDDLALAEDLARRAALAVDNARLLQQTRAASDQVSRHAARLGELAAASQAFAEASLDLPRVLDTAARRAANAIGDGCIIRLVSDDRRLFVSATAYHPNPDALVFLQHILANTTHRVEEGVVGRVAQSGRPLLIPVLPPEEMRAIMKPDFWPFLDRFGIRSFLAVPLTVRGRVIGTLMTWRNETKLEYTVDDQTFLQDLAERAALAIDNARLFGDQVRARNRIHHLAAERELALGHIVDGVIITDAEGRIVFVNDAARSLHGGADLDVSVEDYAASYGLLTLNGDPYPPHELPLARAVLHGETTHNAEWRIRRPDDTEVIARGNAAPVLAEDGSKIGAVLTLHDVTAEREFERHKDEFVATASHDLKTPLTTIKGWAQLLRQRAVRDPTRTKDLPALAAIDRQAQAMQRLIEQMLEASRLQLGQLPDLQVRRIDFHELVTRELALHQHLSDGHTFNLLVNGGSDIAGYGDPHRLAQVIGNLIENAVKYSPAGGLVDVALDSDGDEIRLAVRDTGIGIPAEALPHIFEQFYRAGNITCGPAGQQINGLGLGLFSAQRITALHGGRIEVESVEGHGSTFTVVLPANPRHVRAGEPSPEVVSGKSDG